MKRLVRLAAVAAFLVSMALVSGCDPTKTGGGGYDQPYDRNTGYYK